MKLAMLLCSIAPVTTLVAAATYLAVNGVEGWGWFLFVAAIIGPISFQWKD